MINEQPEPQPATYPALRNIAWSKMPIHEAMQLCLGSQAKEPDRPESTTPSGITEDPETDPRRMTMPMHQGEDIEMPDFDNQLKEANYRRKIIGTISGIPVSFSRKLRSSGSKNVYAVEIQQEPYAMAMNRNTGARFCRESDMLVHARIKGAIMLVGPFPFIDHNGTVYEAALMRWTR